MKLELTIPVYFFISIMVGVLITWFYLLLSTINSLTKSPKLANSRGDLTQYVKSPKVSIILPARNECKYIKKCIDSLLKQTYPNYEIILVNDASVDNTLNIMNDYEKNNSNVFVLDVQAKPEGWIGKNWACYNGYLKSSGSLLLFTDADSFHSEDTLEMSVAYLNSNNLHALTVIPRLLSNDILTKFTLPIFITFLHTRYSPLKVNNPKSKLGYFFGSYFIITKKTYQEIGSHKSVKSEIIEDGALGKKVKEGNYKIMMLRGEHLVTAYWSRNSKELLNAIDRLVVPLFKGNNIKTLMLTIALFFLILSPFVFISYFLGYYFISFDEVSLVISSICILIIFLIILTSIIQTNKTLSMNWTYSLGTPIGSTIIVLGFVKGMIKSLHNGTVNWRGREYVISSDQNPL